MNRNILIFFILISFLLSIGVVSASDINNTNIIDENEDMLLMDVMHTDDIQSSQQPVLSKNNEDILINTSQSISVESVNEHNPNHSTYENITLQEGNYSFINKTIDNIVLICDNASVNINNCTFKNSGVIVNGGFVNIVNCSFSDCNVAITQTGGKLNITNNIIFNNIVGVNITGGECNLLYNALYLNNISLIYSNDCIVNRNNWWGRNNPIYNFNNITNCDICQIGDVKNNPDSWIILNISQSNVLNYDYWIAGITYYNLTVDLRHNNHGEYVSGKLNLNNLTLNYIRDIKERVDYHFIRENKHVHEINYTYDVVSVNVNITDNKGDFVLTYGYLTSDLNEINFSIFGENYTVHVLNDTIAPEINYVTPSTIFDDNLTIKILCEDSDAVIFYTLDGSNPAYSPTRLIYNQPIVINETSTLHYAVIDKYGNFQKYFVDTFITGSNSVSGDTDYVGFIRQDVYLELKSTSYPIYYTFDGSNPAQSTYYVEPKFRLGRENTGSNLIYTHPFIIHEPVEIRCIAQNRNDWHWVSNQQVSMTTYSFDNSVNYIKNSSEEGSDAIWNQYQGDNYNTGVTDMVGPLTNQSSWNNFNIPSTGSAVVDGKGHIYIGGDDGYLYCLNNQGLVIWRYGTTSKIICTPTIGLDGNIYFSNWKDSNAYCISPNGTLIWKLSLGDYNTGTSPVFGLDNRLYIITSNSFSSTIFVINNGVIVYSHVIPCISGSTPAVTSDGTLYMSSLDHRLVVVNFDGSLRTTKTLGSFISDYDITYIVYNTQCSVSVGPDDTIYVLRGQYNYNNYYSLASKVLTAFNPDTTVKWIYDLSNYMVSGTPSYYNGVLYITVNNVKSSINGKMLGGRLLAVNASNGALLWSEVISSSGSTLSSPLISGGEIIYVTSNNCVYAFNISGEKIWEYTMTGQYGNPVSYSSPTLTSDYTLIVTTNQGIYAFRDVAADFTYNHIEGTELSIQFTDLSTNGSNRYFWTFGDGNYSFEQNPNHTYASEGKYRVVLYVEHNGNVTLARNATINVVYHDIIAPSNVTTYINGNLTYGGNFSETQFITLNATDNRGNVTIYYTLDGSSPVNSSSRKVYAGVFDIEIDSILSCVAVDPAGNWGNVSTFEFVITDAFKVNSTLINEIQELLDNAEPGSKFVFSEDIMGANFIINKPLNLITNNATLTGNGIQPVFTFTQSAEGATINGFTINSNGTVGILIDSTSNITVRNCNLNVSDATGIHILNSNEITVKDTNIINALDGIVVNQSSNTNLNKLNIQDSYNNGVWIYQSINTTLSDSLLESNGKDQYESKANHVLVDDSKDTSIYGNTIRHGFFGIHLYHTTDGVIIDNNTIYDGSGDAILLSNTYLNVNITHNLIDGSFNGIDFMGYCENVTIKENTIENLHEHSDDVYEVFSGTPFFLSMMNYIYEVNVEDPDDYFNHRYNGIQVSHPSSNFDEGNTIMIDNVVIKLGHRAWESRKYTGYLNTGCDGYGYNLMDGSASYTGQGGATHYREGKVDLVVDRIGDATFRLRLINRLDGHYLSNIPEFDVTFRAGGFLQTVKFINDSAVATFDVASVVSDIEAIISTEIRKSASFTMEITEGYSSSNRKADPGFERGEAYDNPNPVIPSFDEVVKHYTNPSEPEKPDTGYGNGTGNGNGVGSGTGSGNGNGSGSNGFIGNGKMNIKSNNTHDSNSGDSPDLGEAMDRSSEGGSDAGSGETINAYEVSKVINMEKSNLNFVLAVILFAVIVILGYGYRRRKGDGDEF